MRSKVLSFMGGVLVAVTLAAGPAGAAPGDSGNGVGGCVSGTLYGNTSNPRPSGHGVLPSLSPGPWVLNDGFGASMGDVQQFVHETYGAPAGNYSGRDVLDPCVFP